MLIYQLFNGLISEERALNIVKIKKSYIDKEMK